METLTKEAATIGVIGTTGRDKSRPLTSKHFDYMVDAFEQYINKLKEQHKDKIDPNNITLVSGGAAWADHVAVDYFLKNPTTCKLILYLPCLIVGEKTKQYQFDTNHAHGLITNGYHTNFSKQIGRDTIQDIIRAQEFGAILDNSAEGFKNRNTCIASSSDFLVAFTGVSGPAPLGGGTLDTWKKSKSIYRHHISIPESFTSIKFVLKK
ncbi:hypothetical protein RB653_004970 [Dictyostelium firmibasis]|uniref:Uncharacterized protein n=1 Tax=Dictyostelium firmibasis TaxID=79012 RepID=A0AAN7U723_9MYCE